MTESLILIGSLAMIHCLAVMSPGPDFVVAIKNSLQYSRRAGVLTALGFAVGCMVHITYSVLGLAYLINQSVMLFTAIKVLGALYLIYLGIKALRSKVTQAQFSATKSATQISGFKAFREGFITNVLNPKATLYFLSVFTLAIGPETPLWVLTSLTILIFVITFVWFSLVAVCMTTPAVRSIFLRFSQWVDRTLGSVLVLLGLKLLTTTK